MLDRRDRLGSLGVITGDTGTEAKHSGGGRNNKDRSRWPRGLKLRSAATLLPGLRVQIPPVARISISCDRGMFSGGGLCDWLIPRPEKSY